MPLKLIPPQEGRSANWYIRGTHLGVQVYRSTGTTERKVARKAFEKVKADIEAGAFTGRAPMTFAMAARAYIDNGKDDRFLKPIIAHFKDMPLSEITQAEIDSAAVTLYPGAKPSTRNRQVYTPISAILKHADVHMPTRRPKGHAGSRRVDWLKPEQADAVLAEATTRDAEFGIFLTLLCYTGMRLSEALSLQMEKLHIEESFVYLPDSKNGEDRAIHLPPIVVAAIKAHPQGLDRAGTIFRFRKNGYLYNLMKAVREKTGPEWMTFHTFCHTYGTWMRRYGGLDQRGLVATGRWKSEKSAARYAHVVASEESRKADLLPGAVPKKVRAKPVQG